MEKINDVSTLVYERKQGGRFRWITISTLLLAMGAILHLVSPSIAGFSPNWTIAMYCVAIHLTKASYSQAFGIGMVAALINVMTSKSGFPYGNLISEPVGALVCAAVVHGLGEMKIKNFDLKPAISGFLSTVFSGGVFITLLYFILGLTFEVYFYAMVPAVLLVAAVNFFITPLFFTPAQHLFASRGYNPEGKTYEHSDHSMYELSPAQDGLISMEHLTYSYGDNQEATVKDINLVVHEKDFLVVTGEAGCGKSTLCMAMVGAVPQFYGGKMTGMVFVDGMAVTQVSIADLAIKIGAVLADYDTQLVTMTVEEEIAFALENRGATDVEIEERTKKVLQQVGLQGLETRKITGLSGGQRQRLAIASVLATNPGILVFDEPTSSLDPEGTESFYNLIGDLNRNYGITIVVIDHDLHAAIPYANRIALMHEGRILKDSSVEETLRYMYKEGIYVEAVPSLFMCQMVLEEGSYEFSQPWFDIATAKAEVQQTIGGVRHVRG